MAQRWLSHLAILAAALLPTLGCAVWPSDVIPYTPERFPATFSRPGQPRPPGPAAPAASGMLYRGQNFDSGSRALRPIDPASRPIDPARSNQAYQYPATGSSGIGSPGIGSSGIGGPGRYAPLNAPQYGTSGQSIAYPNGIPPELVNPPSDRPIPLDVFVDETQTGRFALGAGINSDAGLVGSIVIDEHNFDWRRWPTAWSDFGDGTAFRGAGQRFRIEAMPGSEVQRYQFQFNEPYLRNTRVSLGLNGSFFERQFFDYDEKRLGGGIDLGYNLTPDLSTVVSFRAMNVEIRDPRVPAPPAELLAVLGENTIVGFGVSLRHDTRDSAFLATEGHLIELKFEQVVGTFNFPRFDLDMRKYFLLHERVDRSGRHVLSLSGRLGVSGEDTPLFEHYFAGGFSTIRGFDFRGASPRDPVSGVALGGEFLALGSVEYLFPVLESDTVHGVLFCDFGTVERNARLHADNFRVAPGFGLRIAVPAMGPAPIAIDFAFPVAQAPGDEERIFSFFVGFTRG